LIEQCPSLPEASELGRAQALPKVGKALVTLGEAYASLSLLESSELESHRPGARSKLVNGRSLAIAIAGDRLSPKKKKKKKRKEKKKKN